MIFHQQYGRARIHYTRSLTYIITLAFLTSGRLQSIFQEGKRDSIQAGREIFLTWW
jgi:hypothetical protein